MTDLGPSTYSQKHVTLIKKKLAMRVGFPAPVLEQLEGESYLDYMTDNIVTQLKTYVLGEQLPSHTETRSTGVPATWWQHFKHDYAEKWWMRRLVRRRPVVLRTITLTATWENMAAYPWHQLRTELPQYMGAAVRLTIPAATHLDTGVTRYWEGDDDA